jgi:Ca2+-binding RTX toxin-like protein
MTGSSGVNDYLYGASSDSTVAATDVITNFHTADVIDLSGLGIALQYGGKLATSSIAADSVAWQVSSGNTFVYVISPAALKACLART